MNLNLIRSGVFLFLLGLLTGFVIPYMQNPRLGLSSHLEGILNGMFLVILGLIFKYLTLSCHSSRLVFFLSLYAAYANWATTLLAAIWGAGRTLMPLAAGNFKALPWQEGLINFGLISLSISMVMACLLVLWGLRKNIPV
ncbi:Hydroxylaminobenzene mutase HabB [Aquicella siphonis]|uniref:Hydroxylaminobenzene mutase HabB n=1 Tax=Aquicella siphonis TaxID=254247 RepID=A0A5E4PGL2_9COXI|nr:hydrogenase [Aquicella siphonis]VVC75725.1 Hydroxylaminobenzene mutase HabB [Aquicella siphonis]